MNISVETIKWEDDKLKIIDQTKLPDELVYLECTTPEEVAEAIKILQVRGAPAIGIAAAYGVVLGMDKLDETIKLLANTRPTAVNLFWALQRMKRCAKGHKGAKLKKALLTEAILIHEDDKEKCRKMGEYGASLIKDGDTVLTHCNAGALATGGMGTALSPIYIAKKQGKKVKVFADETRPLLQGARLTTWELKQAGIDVTLICDNMAAVVMKEGKIDLVMVGADRIVKNGDVANKIGTYGVAVLAKAHNIPFYVVAPTSTIDLLLEDGSQIPIEERGSYEVTHGFGKRIAPEGINVYSPAFDVTPNSLITAIVTENGIAHPPFIKTISNCLDYALV
ncbi:MAG: S-methyl-5-thioribose-1-phosphate isomerase [bacterium]